MLESWCRSSYLQGYGETWTSNIILALCLGPAHGSVLLNTFHLLKTTFNIFCEWLCCAIKKIVKIQPSAYWPIRDKFSCGAWYLFCLSESCTSDCKYEVFLEWWISSTAIVERPRSLQYNMSWRQICERYLSGDNICLLTPPDTVSTMALSMSTIQDLFNLKVTSVRHGTPSLASSSMAIIRKVCNAGTSR